MGNKFSFSLEKLINNMIQHSENKEYVAMPHEKSKQISVRLEPDIKLFCEDFANKLGINLSSFISMILRGVMTQTASSKTKSEFTLMSDRFLEIIDTYEIPHIGVPQLLSDFNFPLTALAEKSLLLNYLSEPILHFMAKTFHLDKAWLMGKSDKTIFHKLTWYKNEDFICRKLREFISLDYLPSLKLIKLGDFDMDVIGCDDNKMILAIEYYEKYSETGSSFENYIIFGEEPWSNSRANKRMRAIILFCYICGINCRGYTFHGDHTKYEHLLPITQINKLTGETGEVWSPFGYLNMNENPENSINEKNITFSDVCEHFFHDSALGKICEKVLEENEKIEGFDKPIMRGHVLEEAREFSYNPTKLQTASENKNILPRRELTDFKINLGGSNFKGSNND